MLRENFQSGYLVAVRVQYADKCEPLEVSFFTFNSVMCRVSVRRAKGTTMIDTKVIYSTVMFFLNSYITFHLHLYILNKRRTHDFAMFRFYFRREENDLDKYPLWRFNMEI